MPKINRVRIANFVYGGRHITDEIYNFYNGENTLLNLANGGGKSVLVQAMFQPVLPCVPIHKRPIESYFSSNKSPIYIMVEWLLDNTAIPTYLLTGIVLIKSDSNDETSAKVRYFTFTSQYDKSNNYDLKNIPFIVHDGKEITFLPHEKSMDIAKDAERKGFLKYYHSEHKRRYYSDLKSYGILENEWKLIARMNEEEGGIDKLFDDSKTSDNVIDKWVLKTIEESILSGENKVSLSEMFAELMNQVVEQAENINTKTILQEFLVAIEAFKAPLAELTNSLGEKDNKEKQLANIFFSANKEIEMLKVTIQDLDSKLLDYQETLIHIELERLSEDYYLKAKNLDTARQEFEVINEEKIRLETEKQEKTLQKEILEAAKLYCKIKELENKIFALSSQLVALKDNMENNEELKKIEYSLKLAYENQVKNIEEIIVELTDNISDIEEHKNNSQSDMQNNIESQKQHQNQLGGLKANIDNFKKYESDIFEKLSIFINRSILGELEQGEIVKINKDFSVKENEINTNIKECKKEIDNYETRISAIKTEKNILSNQEKEAIAGFERIKSEIEQYNLQEDEIRPIFERRNVAFERRFQMESVSHELKEHQLKTQKRLDDAFKELAELNELHNAFLSGSIHTSVKMAELLTNLDIPYKTGETYINEQPKALQEKLLLANPMLPYCFLIPKSDIEKLNAINSNNFIRHVVPIISFEDAETKFEHKNNTIGLTPQIKAVCLYQKDSFSADNKEEFEQKIVKEIEFYNERLEHYRHEIEAISQDIIMVSRFKYDHSYKSNLEKEKSTKEHNKLQAFDMMKKSENEEDSLLNKIKELSEQIRHFEKVSEQNELNVSLFNEYLKQNELFCSNLMQVNALEIAEQNATKELIRLNKVIEDFKADLEQKSSALKENIQKKVVIEGKYAKLTNCAKTDVLTDDLEVLEERYAVLTDKSSSDIQAIEVKIDALLSSKNDIEKELENRFKHLLLEDYGQVTYNDNKYYELCNGLKSSELALKNVSDKFFESNRNLGKCEAEFSSANNLLNQNGLSEPLPKNEILQNYEIRKGDIKKQQKLAVEKKKEISNSITLLGRICDKIDNKIDVKGFILTNANLPENVLETVENYLEQLNKLNNINKILISKCNKEFEGIIKTFSEKHTTIETFLKGLNWDNSSNDYSSYYYVFEKLAESTKYLNSAIAVINNELENMENFKKNVVKQCHIQGTMLYEEIKKISESSYVLLPERKTKTQMLKIEVPAELDSLTMERIKNHIDNCIDTLRKECEIEKSDKDTMKKISNLISNRQLLNVIINQTKVSVKLYKVDINIKNSGLKAWEDTIVENSGGEKFIACFTLISSLIAYSRTKVREEFGETIEKDSRVFVIDNPFGKTSSKHLLEVMIEVAKKFNTQLICLSDLSQSSITNRFTLIYQLAVRNAMYSNKSYLKTDEVIKNDDISPNERLEHVYMKSEQLSMFG